MILCEGLARREIHRHPKKDQWVFIRGILSLSSYLPQGRVSPYSAGTQFSNSFLILTVKFDKLHALHEVFSSRMLFHALNSNLDIRR